MPAYNPSAWMPYQPVTWTSIFFFQGVLAPRQQINETCIEYLNFGINHPHNVWEISALVRPHHHHKRHSATVFSILNSLVSRWLASFTGPGTYSSPTSPELSFKTGVLTESNWFSNQLSTKKNHISTFQKVFENKSHMYVYMSSAYM
jgi:hypothetical protein